MRWRLSEAAEGNWMEMSGIALARAHWQTLEATVSKAGLVEVGEAST